MKAKSSGVNAGAGAGAIVLQRGLLTQEALEEILRPEKLARPHA